MRAPQRGFPQAEYATRTANAQALMAQYEIAALLLTTEPEIRYYTGFLTRFWESPTRPWFLIIPASGAPIAVIPSIGAHLMGQTWVTDIRTWAAPDYTDDGIGLLTATLTEVAGPDGRIGIASGMESHARLPLNSLQTLTNAIAPCELVSDHAITRDLRLIKSEAEIAKIRHACAIAGRAFDLVPQIAGPGRPLSDVFRNFQALCLVEGADWVPYLAGGADQGGYGDVISPATDRPLETGDVMMLDTGLIWDGYFCDYDRNFSIGAPPAEVAGAHERLIEATQAAFSIAKPGAVISDLFAAMNSVANPSGEAMEAGRLGHGLGMQLTEWPSIIAADHTPLTPGMVLTLEPSVALPGGKIMTHEENIVIREGGPEWLSPPQDRTMRVL